MVLLVQSNLAFLNQELTKGGDIIKIYLDDARKIDHNTYKYNRVYTYEQCVILMDAFKNDLEFISLDYHLGSESMYSGYDVLLYMQKNNIRPRHINIHSDHSEGANKMHEFAREHFRSSVITRTKIKQI